MTLQDLMMLYGVTLGRRYTKRQKTLFAQHLSEVFPPLGYPLQVQEQHSRLRHVQNAVAGDLQKARLVIAVPYDTPAHTLWPCKYYPFHPELTLREARCDIILQLVLAVVLFAGSALAVWAVLARHATRWLLLAAAALAAAGTWRLWGHANRVNFNRFSASLALAEKLAQDRPRTPGLAFAFCDRCANGYDGYRLLAQYLPPDATVLLLDCLASGQRLVLAHGPRCAGRAEALLAHLPDAQRRAYTQDETARNLLALFPNGLLLTSGAVEKGEFVVRGTCTGKDVALDLPRLRALAKGLAAFAKEP